MGKWADVKYDDVMVGKTRALFKYVEERLKKDHPENPFSFENFVETLDENDSEIRRCFEHLVREVYKHKHQNRSRGPYSSPPPLSHRFRPRSVISPSPFLQSFGSSTSSSDLSNDNDSDGDQLDPITLIALERELRERERDRLPLSSASSTRRGGSRMGITSELDLSEYPYYPSHVRSQPQSIPSSSGSHVFERFRDRERDIARRERIRAHAVALFSDHTSNSTHTSSGSGSQSETTLQQSFLPISEIQSYRRLHAPTTLGLSPPAPIPDRPSSPLGSPPSSRMVIRRVGIDQRVDLRHYMREADPMYLEHRERSFIRDRGHREGRPTYHEGLEREFDTTVENTDRRRERDTRLAILQGIERELRQFGDGDGRVRRVTQSGIPTPPHVAEGEEGDAAATAATGTTAEGSV